MPIKPTYEELERRVRELENAELDRGKSEKYLGEQNGFLENVINALCDTVYIFDEDTGTGVMWNRSLQEIGGYDYEKARHYPPTYFYPEEEHECIEKVIENVKEKGRAKVELNYIVSDGRRIPFEYVVVPVPGPKGQKWLCAIGRDITDRKRVEAALQEKERVMRYIIKHDPTAIAVYDHNLNYIAVSDRYLQDYNVTEKNVLGKHHYLNFRGSLRI